MLKPFLYSLIFLFIASCTLEEGEGGSATIQGRVFVEDVNNQGEVVVANYGPDWEVFIVYGDDVGVSDRTITHYDGTYRFNFLTEGEYTVYAYSECDFCINNIEPVIIDTIIMERDELVILPDLVVID
jgi:hypothetical protein